MMLNSQMIERVAVVGGLIWVITDRMFFSSRRKTSRTEYIRTFIFPDGLYHKLRKNHPVLTLKDCQLVGQALRAFFLAYHKSNRKFVSMPSQVVDDLWHEFILYTKDYDAFCRRAFGNFLHHSPAAILGSSKQSNVGLRRVWWFACREENINPRSPTRLPLLFAIDAKLNIPNGFKYEADCKGMRKLGEHQDAGSVIFCGGDFSSSDIDGSVDGFAENDGHGHAGGGGDGHDGGGHGCGGHGCGGGGCGGD